MESVTRARARLAQYPILLSKCSVQAATYGRCVGTHLDGIEKDQCSKEFKQLMDCIRANAAKLGTRL